MENVHRLVSGDRWRLMEIVLIGDNAGHWRVTVDACSVHNLNVVHQKLWMTGSA
jgi:hypothetical protein